MCYSCGQSDSIPAILGRGQKWQNDNLLLQPAPAPLTLIIRLGLGHHPKFHFIIEFLPWLTISNIFHLKYNHIFERGQIAPKWTKKAFFLLDPFWNEWQHSKTKLYNPKPSPIPHQIFYKVLKKKEKLSSASVPLCLHNLASISWKINFNGSAENNGEMIKTAIKEQIVKFPPQRVFVGHLRLD